MLSMAGLGNYDGASLTIVRNGGASADDVFDFKAGGGITLVGGNLIKNSQIIATFDTTTTPGELVITFTDANGEIPTSIDVDSILSQITYANSSGTPPHSVTLDWSFDDGNTGTQGAGGAQQGIGSTVVYIVVANDPPTDLSPGIQINMDGGNDAYLLANDGGAVLGGASQFTVEIAFATHVIADTPLISYAAGGTGGNDFNISLLGDGTAEFWIDANNIILSGIDYDTLLDGQLHHLAFSWDNSNGDWAIYVDGALIEAGEGFGTGVTLLGSPGTGEIVLGGEQDSIGGGFDSSQVFQGTYHDVRIWSEVRSAQEIALNYQNKIDSSSLPATLLANWQMDQFNGSNEVVDVVGANNLSIGHAAEPDLSPARRQIRSISMKTVPTAPLSVTSCRQIPTPTTMLSATVSSLK